jgi:hypothetical protein
MEGCFRIPSPRALATGDPLRIETGEPGPGVARGNRPAPRPGDGCPHETVMDQDSESEAQTMRRRQAGSPPKVAASLFFD